jgi:copper chaperone CopZ
LKPEAEEEWAMLTLKVEGMSCGHCVAAVTRAVQSVLPGAKVDVDLASGGVVVNTTKPLAQGEVAQVQSAIAEAGYDIILAS